MIFYILRRLAVMALTLVFVSMVTFIIIQLPPGDYLTTKIANLAMSGEAAGLDQIETLRQQYGLDKPLPVQYGKWVWGMVHGDLGNSFLKERPVGDLIWDRIGYTTLIAVLAMIAAWVISLPIGVYAAVKQYGVVDYIATFIGLVGMATPAFLLALMLLFFANRYWGQSLGGLFDVEYMNAPWSWGRLLDLLQHLWLPVLVLCIGAVGGMIRTVRANLLDQMQMPYVDTARAKGMPEWKLILKYPTRIAINPLISTIGWMLPQLISATVIVDVVLSLPTTGPLLLEALLAQDMYLAGALVMMLAILTMVGTLVSDILLAWADPRIRFEGGSR
jgi:peptide/nickel transport system permease protein